MTEELDECALSVLRRQNRALRKIHKTLRSALKSSKDYSDTLFIELCDSDNESRLAMEKLWMLGQMQDICSPQDYEKIVEVCLSRMNVTIPIDQS